MGLPSKGVAVTTQDPSPASEVPQQGEQITLATFSDVPVDKEPDSVNAFSAHAQKGVRKVEAATITWEKKHLVVTYAL